MRSECKKLIINAAAITVLLVWFALIIGSTPVIAGILIFIDHPQGCDTTRVLYENTTKPNATSQLSSRSGDARSDQNPDITADECQTKNSTATRLKLGLALLFALCSPCLLLLLIKISRAVKSEKNQDIEVQVKGILELAEVSEDTGDITEEQSQLIKHMVYHTWLYDSRLGKDSRALTHQTLDVKQIVRVNNQNLLKVYQKECSSITDAVYPDELMENPILTMETCISRGQGQIEESGGQAKISNNQIQSTESNEIQAEPEVTEGSGIRNIMVEQDGYQTNSESGGQEQVTDENQSNNTMHSKVVVTDKNDNTGHTAPGMETDEIQYMQNQINNSEVSNSKGRPLQESIDNVTQLDIPSEQLVSTLQENRSQTTSFIGDLSLHTHFNLEANEVYLFHGTKLENIPNILKRGFQLRKARRCFYGKAIYLAESSEKADQYADSRYSRRHQNLAMLVVRVAVGNVHCHYTEGAVSSSFRHLNPQSVVVAGIHKRFREFLIFQPKRLYPEFIVFYDRK